jgi:hypothetical protein
MQGWHFAAAGPAAAVPAAQGWHVEAVSAPMESEAVPAAQDWHWDWPGLATYCPAAHDVHFVAAGPAAKVPVLHGWHVEAVSAPMESEAVPAAQD